jgi:isopropylmalate/homocitrate/citramalate synthase
MYYNKHSNLIEKVDHIQGLHNVKEANLYKDIFPYSEIPKVAFNHVQLPMNTPKNIWITDTTFRDGQQSMAPFTEKQILKLYDYLHELDNNSGIIKQTEFFLYSKKDRDALVKCIEKGYKFPEITSWIRANKKDFILVKEIGLKETGILMSCSDYHIFKKLNMTRQQAFDSYVSIVEDALMNGIVPRCHFEDITRADFFGFVIPLASTLMELSRQAGIPVKIRACDTLGLGISYSGAALPRSVQGIIHGLINYAGVPSENLEWHGHNDFYSVVPNATTAWLYGCSSINTTLLGIGERTGNCPLEAMLIEYAQIKGNLKNVKLQLITEIGDYFEKELKYEIPLKTPFVGKEFNATRAGVHADGILKDEEIYNIFDTDKILGRPIVVAINEYSGHAGIAAWINTYFRIKDEYKIDKKNAKVALIKDWIDEQYKSGRTTVMTNEELEEAMKEFMPEILTLVVSEAS